MDWLGFDVDPVGRVSGQKARSRYHTHSTELKRKVALEYLAGETLKGSPTAMTFGVS